MQKDDIILYLSLDEWLKIITNELIKHAIKKS